MGLCVRRGELLTGCVPVNGVDKCFTGEFAAGPSTCAKAAGGYNLTSFASLLAAGRADDGREGSLCDPKVPHTSLMPSTPALQCTTSCPSAPCLFVGTPLQQGDSRVADARVKVVGA